MNNRILRRGIVVTLIPLAAVAVLTLIINSFDYVAATKGCSRLAETDLNHQVGALYAACRTYHEDLASALKGAKVLLDSTGKMELHHEHQVEWIARNQFGGGEAVRLPVMSAGTAQFLPVVDINKEAPVVDQVQRLYGTTATVFQRMNANGDMLRVATTVKESPERRAIGTYIPAFDLSGKANPVLSVVLRGGSFLGRAFVVNSWYLAAYQPLLGARGDVVGMIFAGLPESKLRAKLERFNGISTAAKSDIFILHAASQSKGLFVFSSDKDLEGKPAIEHKDAAGDLYVQRICKAALDSKAGDISEISFMNAGKQGSAPRKMMARFTYFPEWDWVIGVQEPYDQFLDSSNAIKRVFYWTTLVLAAFCLASVWFSYKVWRKFSNSLCDRMESVVQTLQGNSQNLSQGADSIAALSSQLAVSSSSILKAVKQQEASSENTSSTTSIVTETAQQNSGTATKMSHLSSAVQDSVQQAAKTLDEVDDAMKQMDQGSDQILGVIDSIDELSFATNIVSLNASIEAARAGAAGAAFAVVASEIRDLAARCGAAANQTRRIIGQSRIDIGGASEKVVRLIQVLQPVKEKALQLQLLATKVSDASGDQVDNLKQVFRAVGQVKLASEDAASVAEAGAAHAESLQGEVSKLVLLAASIDEAVALIKADFAKSI